MEVNILNTTRDGRADDRLLYSVPRDKYKYYKYAAATSVPSPAATVSLLQSIRRLPEFTHHAVY